MIPINAASCVFPAGPDIALAELALRTDFAYVRRHPFYLDRSGERVVASYFNDPETDFDLTRWQALTEVALTDLLNRLEPLPQKSLQDATWHAWLVLPEQNRPGVPANLAHALLPTLDTWPYTLHGVEAIFGGHACGVKAIATATELQPRLIRNLSHDYNGEPYRADEYGFTALRLAEQLDPEHTRHTPALVSGDLGAASAITHTALAAWSTQKSTNPAAHLILASSDDPLRSAVVLYGNEKDPS